MTWRGTLFLGVALLAAALYLYRDLTREPSDATWQTLIEGPGPPVPGADIKRLLSFEPAAVTAIRLRRGDREWRLTRTPDGWSAGAPPAVDDFLKAVQEMAEILPLQVPPDALRDHGLDPPQASIELERNGQPPVVVLLGERNPPATGVYVQLGPGGPVALTGALILWEFDKATRAFAPAS